MKTNEKAEAVRERERERELYFRKIKNSLIKIMQNKKIEDSNVNHVFYA